VSVDEAQVERYDELLQQTGAALLGAAPQGWRRIDLIAKIADGVQDFGLTVIMADLSDAEVEPPAQAAQALVELRRLTYRPELGAWLSARFVVDPPGEFHIFYNYDHDPLWDPPVPPEVFEGDLAAFPRPPERVPGWLGGPPVAVRQTPLGHEGERDLMRKIADLLVVRAPADRQEIRVVYRAAGNHEELVGHVIGLDGRLREWSAPPEVSQFYRQLRAGMFKDGVGTWSAASTLVGYPITTSIRYLSRENPRWHRPPPRTAVLDELEMFPRTPENVADWMKAILPNAERVAEVAGRFRRARIFDHRDAGGRPVVDRPPVPEAELAQVLQYLNTAHVVVGGRGFDPDVFDPDSAPDVPAGYHTDGAWIWTASVPHHLAKHGVPPEPDLVAHIRANGFTPPQLDQETKSAAYTALTGDVPAPPPEQPELSARDRRVLAIIERKVSEAGVIPQMYRILGSAEGAVCLERVGDEWQVADYERGQPRNWQRFAELWNAGAHLLGTLTIISARGGPDRNTAKALNDWPIQPLPEDPPLTLLQEKHIAVLMPGRELVRYGPPTGNLTFAAGTEFSAMSLRVEREQHGPRRYRVVRELRALAGQAVPWHDQPGGGAAYLLPRSVGQHMANGSLAELT
jgi:hypothetical protein